MKRIEGPEAVLAIHVSSLIRHWRDVRQLSQEDLAKKIGTKQSAIARMETWGYLPSLSQLVKIADVLGKEVEIRFK